MSGDGTVWIPILPQMRGFAASMVEGTGAASKQASAALTAEMAKAGEAAGKAAADGLGKGVKDVEAASQKLGAARKAEGEAAKQVKAAETELAETRKSGTASSGELAAAEAKVEAAHKKASDASAQVTTATKDLTSAKGLLSSASKEVADAAGKVAEAQRKEEDAANKVGVAEAKLADLQAKGTATAGQLEAATAGVEKAKNDLATASDKTASAHSNLAAAQDTAAASAADVAAGASNAGGDLDGMGDSADGAMTKMQKFGAAAGVAIAAAGAALLAMGSDFHAMESNIRVGTGAAGEDLEGLVDIAHNVAKSIPADFDAVGSTVADLNTRLGLTGPTLEKLSAQVLEAGRMMGDIDINKLGGAFQAFGVTGEETTDKMDMLFRVSQATGVGISELSDSLVKGAPALKQFGFSIDDSAAMLGQLDKAGVRGDQVISQMSKALVKFAADGKEPQEALKGTIREIENMVSAGNSNGAIGIAENLFGTKGAASFLNAVETGTLSVEDFLGATGATGDEILALGEETRSFSEQWQMFKNEAMSELAPVAEKVFGIITDGMGWIKDNAIPAVKEFSEWITDNKVVLGVLAGAVTAVVLPALGSLALAWTTAKVQAIAAGVAFVAQKAIMVGGAVATGVMTAAQWALNSSLLANPITWIVLLIVGLIAVIVLIATKTTWFQTIWDKVWGFIKTAASKVWDWLKIAFDGIMDAIGWVGDKATWLWDEAIKPAFEWIAEKAQWLWDQLKAAFDFIKDGFQALSDKAGEVKDWIVDRFNDVVNFVRELPGKIATAASGMWDGIKNAFKGAINWIIDKWNGLKFTIGGGSFMGVDIPSMTLGVPEIPRFATGGPINGKGTGTSDDILLRASNGEFIINAKSTAQHLPLIEAINSGTLPAFRKGGMVEAQSFARGESGKPYQYGGVGNPSWDCSGYMSGIYATITGKNPKTRHFTTESDFDALGFKKGRGGKNDFSIGVKRGGGGRNSHMAGTLGDLHVESGGNGVIAGSGAQGADDFPLQWYYPMAGDDPDASVSGLGAGVDLAGGTSGTSGGGGSGSSSYTDGDGTKVWVTNWPTGSSTTSTTSSGGGNGGSTTTSVSSGEVMGDNPNAVDYGIWGSDPEAGVVDALLEIFELNDVLSAEQLIGTRESRYGVGGAAAGTPIGGGVEDGTGGPSTVGMVVHGDVITQDTDELLEKQEASLRAAQAAGGL